MCAKADSASDEMALELAQALYGALDSNEGAFVSGEPIDGWSTRLDGEWDLVEVAKKVLSSWKRERPEG